jgi:hypothetical protein
LALLIESVPDAVIAVVPVPPIVPPVQEKAPETVRVPVPARVPPERLAFETVSIVVTVTVPLETVAVSAAPGTVPPQLDHLAASVQSPVVPSQTQLFASSSRGEKSSRATSGNMPATNRCILMASPPRCSGCAN